ncbi:uncharacterized protein BO87DRAFT_409003 [Aspergillus neoniger CBS 115656]|uniref:Phosphotransferase family protein n=1 Tax=Aspergillus neoniger (strain CBS 115656) TaxID=1448310 RepID=A0A318YAR0_ASPNB|nr:hypothetical protein BO87DRAFT_409003 [Aspergillus neoniger CBS 115656]PYH31436.1 hypothetical protein BO87DRAFT_409003 [Aspergillus neoniger CBS 115656]
MATTITLPYYAPDIPCPLPTTSEIDAAPDISLEYGGRRIVEIGDHLVVKFGKGVELIEGENMLFVQEYTSIRVPRVYALYSDPSTGKKYIYDQHNVKQVVPKNKTAILLCAISDPPPLQPWDSQPCKSLDDDRLCTAVNSRLARESFPLHFRKMAVIRLTSCGFNEHLRLAERFLEFDVLVLQNIVSRASGHLISELRSFTKLSEGGYNRVFEATFNDGKSSEAATLDYLRLHGLRTPEVYAWCSTKANPIGAEYIIMEKLDGTPLGHEWFSMTPKEQYKIMTQIVEWETRLMSLEFPASGSLYYSKDLPSEKRTKLDDPNGMAFCIGPIAHYSWWQGERGIMNIDRGPWPSSPNNILVSDTNEMTGLIDWQHCAILPLGIVAGIPAHFQNYGDPESEMLKQPQLNLPSDYDSMTPTEQNSVKESHRRRVIHFLYATLTKRLNQDHYNAIFDQSIIFRQRLFQSAGTPWEGDSVSLRAELIRSIMNWSAIVKSTHVAPPVDYPEDVVREIVDFDTQQRGADVAMKQMRHALVVDIMGWAARRLASEIKGKMLEAAETPDETYGI